MRTLRIAGRVCATPASGCGCSGRADRCCPLVHVRMSARCTARRCCGYPCRVCRCTACRSLASLLRHSHSLYCERLWVRPFLLRLCKAQVSALLQCVHVQRDSSLSDHLHILYRGRFEPSPRRCTRRRPASEALTHNTLRCAQNWRESNKFTADVLS